MPLVVNNSLDNHSNRPDNHKYLKQLSDGNYRPYLTVLEANQERPEAYRAIGLTYRIGADVASSVEYWYQFGTTDNDLVVKQGGAGATGASGTSGRSGFSGFSGAKGDIGPGGGDSGFSGFSGTSGKSGFSGTSGFSGSGVSGFSGSGVSGVSGFSGLGLSGVSGFSGTSGFSGVKGDIGPGGGDSGFSGKSGFSGTSGINGASGVSGFSGTSGVSGASGTSGVSGTSGRSGFSGTSVSGFSGASGFNGTPGTSGTSGYSGSGISGFSGANGAAGTSGFSGAGTSGFSGGAGASGASGVSGFSGRSGFSGATGATGTGVSGFSGTSGFSGIPANLFLGPEFVGTGLDSSNRVYIDAAQLSVNTIPTARFGAGTIPTSAVAATGGSTGKVLDYGGTWVSNGTTNVQMTANGAGFTVTPPVSTGYNANVMTLGTNTSFNFINEVKSLQRFDIVAVSSDIWLRADNVNVEANVLGVQFQSGNATGTSSQVSSYAHSMRTSLWNSGTSSNYLSFSGMRNIASTTTAGGNKISFIGNSTNSLLSAGTLLFSIPCTGIPTFADNTAATGGGLVTGDLYKTSAGSLQIVL